MRFDNKVTINFELPSMFPMLAKLDLEAYKQWCQEHGLEAQLDSEQVLIYEYVEIYKDNESIKRPKKGSYGRTWVDYILENKFGLGGEVHGSTSCDIPTRFLVVII